MRLNSCRYLIIAAFSLLCAPTFADVSTYEYNELVDEYNELLEKAKRLENKNDSLIDDYNELVDQSNGYQNKLNSTCDLIGGSITSRISDATSDTDAADEEMDIIINDADDWTRKYTSYRLVILNGRIESTKSELDFIEEQLSTYEENCDVASNREVLSKISKNVMRHQVTLEAVDDKILSFLKIHLAE